MGGCLSFLGALFPFRIGTQAASLTLMCAARLNRDDAKLVDEVELDVPDPPR